MAAAHIEKRFIPRQLQSIEQSIARVGLVVSNLGLKIKMLVDSAGEVVTREEIRRTLWPNATVVELDHSINAAIKKSDTPRGAGGLVSGAEGALKATFYMVDRPVPGLPASEVAIQGSNVTITIPAIGGTYEGILDRDAMTLTGKWTAGGTPMPLTLAHVKDDAAWEIPKPPHLYR